MSSRPGEFSPLNLLLILPAVICFSVIFNVDFLGVEAVLLAASLVAVAMAGNRLKWTAAPPRWCAPLRRGSRNPWIACVLPGALSVVLRVALLPWIPIPQPVVPDEFSHRLLAETFLAGRLANPPHPLWPHFESIHIISQPTYSSMYMAGQAVFLALGKLIAGDLFWGVVLSTALFCSALTWCLRAYVPPGWALYGGILAAVRVGGASYWNNSYWGGSAGALGGALILGAYPRLIRRWSLAPAAAFALGLVVLANSRPYEGALMGAVLTAAIAWEIFKRRSAVPWVRIATSAAAVVAILAISGFAMTRHWKAVTGSALTLPYQVNQRTYGWPMTLPWQRLPEVTYRHAQLALYHDFEAREHELSIDPSQIGWGALRKFQFLWRFFFGVTLSVLFVFGAKILKLRRMRVAWIAAGVVFLAVITEQTSYPHYLSPAAPAVFLFIVEGLRHASHWRAGRFAIGPALVRLALPLMGVVIALRAATMGPGSPPSDAANYPSWCCTDARMRYRGPIEQKLDALPGDQLAIVTYRLKQYETIEWVYNEPDIDRAKIVWARDMGAQANQELIRYFPKRRVWNVVVTPGHAEIEPYAP